MGDDGAEIAIKSEAEDSGQCYAWYSQPNFEAKSYDEVTPYEGADDWDGDWHEDEGHWDGEEDPRSGDDDSKKKTNEDDDYDDYAGGYGDDDSKKDSKDMKTKDTKKDSKDM